MFSSITKQAKTTALAISMLIGLQACVAQTQRMVLPATLPEPVRTTPAAANDASVLQAEAANKQIRSLPGFVLPASLQKETLKEELDLPKASLTLNSDGLALNDFIHLALGEVLEIPFKMDAAIAARKDAVTLNVSKPMPAERLFGIVKETLDLHGVSIVQSEYGHRVLPKAELNQQMARLANNQTKIGSGQVAEVMPLKYVSMTELQAISGSIFQLGKYGRTTYNKRLNAIVVIGEANRVERFKEFLNFLDRPSFNKSHLRMVRPIYWQAGDLAKQLINVMAVQGIPVSDKVAAKNGVVVLVMKSMNALFIASPQKTWMDQAEAMIKALDGPDAAGPGVRTFIYFTRHRSAEELGSLVSSALGGNTQLNAEESNAEKPAEFGGGPAYKVSGLNVVVDDKRSALIFIGESSTYQLIVPILSSLDIPVRQVLIEVTVADVSLDDTDQLGVEWKMGNGKSGSSGYGATLGTLGGLGVGSGGLSYVLSDSAGNVRAKINALATRGKAKILSSPTLLAMDGEKAHMQVGTQVSVVTQEVSNVQAGGATDTNLLRSFQYIDTGVILDISPSITDYGSIRMELKQEVSEPGSVVGDGQPPIFKRVVDTVMVAESGQTVLLGGLITHNKSLSKTQVPILGDLPIIGGLFRNEAIADRSTELIILITPHIIRDRVDANELTKAYHQALGW